MKTNLIFKLFLLILSISIFSFPLALGENPWDADIEEEDKKGTSIILPPEDDSFSAEERNYTEFNNPDSDFLIFNIDMYSYLTMITINLFFDDRENEATSQTIAYKNLPSSRVLDKKYSERY